jgi:hypothetical protein
LLRSYLTEKPTVTLIWLRSSWIPDQPSENFNNPIRTFNVTLFPVPLPLPPKMQQAVCARTSKATSSMTRFPLKDFVTFEADSVLRRAHNAFSRKQDEDNPHEEKVNDDEEHRGKYNASSR